MPARQGSWVLVAISVLCLFTSSHHTVQAQIGTMSQNQLQRTIASLDAQMFEAYNRCELDKFGAFLADDLELYHDRDGVVIGRQTLTDNVKKHVCGGDVRRELVAGSLQVHAMEGYGALCTGVHRFRHPKSNAPAAERSFVNLWRYKDGTWKLSRAISFDSSGRKSAF